MGNNLLLFTLYILDVFFRLLLKYDSIFTWCLLVLQFYCRISFKCYTYFYYRVRYAHGILQARTCSEGTCILYHKHVCIPGSHACHGDRATDLTPSRGYSR